MEELFFELLQVAVGQRERLSHAPSEEEWRELFCMARKQAVLGVCFHAVQQLHDFGQRPPQPLIYEWFSIAETIRKTNEQLTKRCCKLQEKLAEAGIRSSILKGQGIATYYDKELSVCRQPGDIDVYVDCGFERAIQFAHDCGQKDVDWDYKHLHLDVFRGTEVEMHYRVEVLLNLIRNRKLQRWFKEHESGIYGLAEITEGSLRSKSKEKFEEKIEEKHLENIKEKSGSVGLVMPVVEFNLFYILLHIYRHFLYEGVGLRQIMDYYYTLKRYSGALRSKSDKNNIDNCSETVALDAVRVFGMERFAKGLMWVMQTVMAMPEEWMLWEPDRREGEYILRQVMRGGNFGHHDERLVNRPKGKVHTVIAVTKHNLHLLWHYPSEVIWPPIWFVWHKWWKWTKKRGHV